MHKSSADTATRWVAAGLLAWYAWTFLHTPIWAGDFDLWYHLAGGRYTSQTGAPPATSYFSFVRPARAWVDYYWLFQVVAYKVFSWLGYPGLIWLRAGLFCSFLAAVYALCAMVDEERRPGARAIAVTTLCAVLFLYRYLLLRPHDVSYLLLCLVLLALDRKGPWNLAAPLLALVWMNVHGIYYPVLLLICLAYAAEYGWRRVRGSPFAWRSDGVYLASLAASMGALFATPHGRALISVPYVSTAHANLYIQELARVPAVQYFSAQVAALVPSFQSVVNLIGAGAAVAALRALWLGRLRLSHLLLFLGGGALLSTSGRFRWEFALLSIPVLVRGFSPGRSEAERPPRRALLRWGALALLVAVNVLAVKECAPRRGKYPLSPDHLPLGVVNFLKTEGHGGTILNEPDAGGFLEWELYPRYRIFMDMEVPFLFADFDIFAVRAAALDPVVLKRLVARYRPTYILMHRSWAPFRDTARSAAPSYRPVFFDDTQVLYADAGQEPELVAKHELKALDPFRFDEAAFEDAIQKNGEPLVLAEARRLVGVHPASGVGNQLLALLARRQKRYEEIGQRGQVLAREYPASPVGYRLQADALNLAGKTREALPLYREALDRGTEPYIRGVWKELGFCYGRLGDTKAAYRWLKKGINPFAVETTFDDLYHLGSSALAVGKAQEGLSYFKWALLKEPKEGAEKTARIRSLLKELEADPDPWNPTIFPR